MSLLKIRKIEKNVPKTARALADDLLKDLEAAKRPILQAIKCSLDNSFYNPKVGYLTPGQKRVKTELNVSSVQKMARVAFLLEILIGRIESGGVNTKREFYYIAKGLVKDNPGLKPLDFEDQSESDSIIEYICDLFEVYREEMNCYANDRGGQTYSRQLIVEETLLDGTKATVDLSTLGTTPFQPKNRPQALRLRTRGKIEFGLIVESEGTANTLIANGFTKRHKAIVIGASGVPSNGVRGWVKTIQDQLKVPLFFWGDLDAYTIQNIYRTLKAGSAASLIRNKDFSAPKVHFLGVLPDDVKRYDLDCYQVKEKDSADARALKKAKDALQNDPFFQDNRNKKIADVLRWLIKEKIRCEQQAYFSVDAKNPLVTEEIILEKIRKKRYI